jgi:twitching motility protein PilT
MAVIEKIFAEAVKRKASDVHVAPGEPFIIRYMGKLVKLEGEKLTNRQCEEIIFEVLTDEQKKIFNENQQLDFALDFSELGRFRGSVMMHNRGSSAVFRIIPPGVPTLESLGLPDIVKKTLDNHQGLILVTGATGHGKSTTMAAMIDYINTQRAHHILTIEDPIEFVHPLKKGVVNQRQLSRDTHSYANSLRGALREDPDVIMVGELRDLETISMAISAAETGHLVIATLSTSSAHKTVDRIIDSYPPGEQNQIRAMLSETLRAVITQRLLPNKEENAMELAVEILIGTLPMTNLIKDAKTFQIPSLMQTAKNVGMQIMDDSIMALLTAGKISVHCAYMNAANQKLFKVHLDKEKAEAKK